MHAVYKINPPKSERQLREKIKNEQEHLETLPESERAKLDSHFISSGNRAYNEQLKRKAKNTFGF